MRAARTAASPHSALDPAIRNPKAFTIEWPLANANPRSGFVSLANSFNFDDLVDILQH